MFSQQNSAPYGRVLGLQLTSSREELSVAYGYNVCGLTHSFACLVCLAPCLCQGLARVGRGHRGQGTANKVALLLVCVHSRAGHGGWGATAQVNVTPHFLEHILLLASVVFSPVLPRHVISCKG